MKKNRLNMYCPYCGTKLLDGKEGSEIDVSCKKCKVKVSVSFNSKKINIEILNEMSKACFNSS